MSIVIDQARAIIAGALDEATHRGLAPLCVVVLDAGGHIVAVERQDGASYGRFDIAFAKAHGAVAVGVSSRRLGEMAVERPHFMDGVVATLGGSVVPVAGGVLVDGDDGAPIGAVGVSGDSSDNDEAAALAGIATVGLVARPG